MLRFLLISCLLALTLTEIRVHCALNSGLYVDNNLGQMVPYHMDSHEETIGFTRDVLSFLDLPYVTKRRRRAADEPRLHTKSASQYIYNIYRNTVDNEKAMKYNFTTQDIKAIQSSNVIAAYAASFKANIPNQLRFDVSETPIIDKVIHAELQLYRSSSSESFAITLHSVKNNSQSMRLVSSMNVSADFVGWIRLNVTETLSRWMENREPYNDLQLSFFQGARRLDDTENYLVGLCMQDPDSAPFIVGYFSNLKATRVLTDFPGVSNKWKRSSPFTNPNINEASYVPRDFQSKDYRKRFPGLCRARSLYVRFNELKFDNYIVAPEGFDTSFCAGHCHFPLGQTSVHATNHAVVQAFVHFLHPEQAPPACCTAHELDDLSVVYSDNGVNTYLKIYPGMIVKSCGCL